MGVYLGYRLPDIILRMDVMDVCGRSGDMGDVGVGHIQHLDILPMSLPWHPVYYLGVETAA